MKDSKMLELMGKGLAWENVTKAKTNSAGHSLIGIAPRVAAMEADAARYRWLRGNGHEAIGRDRGAGPEWTYGDDLDALIDEAMLKTPNA